MERVGDAVNIFSYDCGVISEGLQNLGLKLVENMEDTIIESIFTETDFSDRSVLKIICENEYELLMKDPKVSDLLDLLWVGKNTYDCDGRVTDFSLLSYLSIA